jgi:NifU-like protein involved in Fe-S cluster formation
MAENLLHRWIAALCMNKSAREEDMPGETDLIKLYSSRILALAADIPHLERLEAPDATVKKRSPLCGSTVTVDVTTENGRITGFGQDVKACALGQASASVVGRAIIGATRAQVEQARDQLSAMLKQGGPVPDPPFDGLEVLLPARDYKNRHASILLTLEAAAEAMEKAEQANCA